MAASVRETRAVCKSFCQNTWNCCFSK